MRYVQIDLRLRLKQMSNVLFNFRELKTKVDKTALHIASTEGHLDVVEVLLQCDLDINAQDMVRKFETCIPNSISILICYVDGPAAH